MHSFVLQDWITLRGQTTLALSQNAQDWLDLSPFQDVFFWVSVTEVTSSGNLSLYLETSPTEDDALFQSIAGGGGTPVAAIGMLAASATPVVLKYPMLTAPIPISRYLRWKLTNSAGLLWDVTMRIVVAANSPGM